MKKIIFGIILFMLPFTTNAICDAQKHETYDKYARNITYENDYILKKGMYDVTLYNVIDGLYVKYKDLKFPDEDGIIKITDIKEGETLTIEIYADDGCTRYVRAITINEPYYNEFYNTPICEDYKNKIVACTDRFVNQKLTTKLVEESIKTYNNKIYQSSSNVEEDNTKEPTVVNKIIDFTKKWGIKILLVAITSIITIAFFKVKERKIKHGI